MPSGSPTGRPFAGALALIAWIAVALQIFLVVRVVTSEGRPFIDGVVNTLSYFTVLTNLLVALVTTATFMRGVNAGFLTRPGTMTATAVYILVVGLIYALLLRSLWEPTGLQRVADEALHVATPVLYVLYWLVFVPKGSLRWSEPLYWLIYPIAYFVYFVARGALTGIYVYPFGDIGALGLSRVLVNAVLFLVGFLALGLIFVAIDRLLSRSRGEAISG
jgi:hypothetical protein